MQPQFGVVEIRIYHLIKLALPSYCESTRRLTRRPHSLHRRHGRKTILNSAIDNNTHQKVFVRRAEQHKDMHTNGTLMTYKSRKIFHVQY